MSPAAPEVLWWGRFDPAYARNAVLRGAFAALGWRSREFRPLLSAVGHVDAGVRGVPPAALVWVPCFRQRDIAAARRFATANGIPLVADPLISAYDKQVNERQKLDPGGRRARRLLAWERGLLAAADRVVADTPGHLRYFEATLGVDAHKLYVIPVGAEERMFRPRPVPDPSAGIEVLFYGSFIGLQGVDTIVEAARRTRRPGVTFTLVGAGPELARCRALGAGIAGLRFEPWVDYAALPGRIHRAHLLLGVFGRSAKAGRVIPNKVYQALASARAVVTRESDAYPRALVDEPSPGLTFVPAADPAALADAVQAHVCDPARLAAAGREARRIHEHWFSAAQVLAALARLLASLGLPAAGAEETSRAGVFKSKL